MRYAGYEIACVYSAPHAPILQSLTFIAFSSIHLFIYFDFIHKSVVDMGVGGWYFGVDLSVVVFCVYISYIKHKLSYPTQH